MWMLFKAIFCLMENYKQESEGFKMKNMASMPGVQGLNPSSATYLAGDFKQVT